MKTSEFRRGNIVEWNKKPFIISIIFEDCVENELWCKPINEIHPIPLTEEILLKCGFKKTPANNSYYLPIAKLKAEVHFEMFRGGLVCVLYCSTGSFIPNDIKYLHQLQNLYSSLTEEELNTTKINELNNN